MNSILINCDMGEWNAPHLRFLDDKIMPLVDLSNIACGGHAGSRTILKYTLHLARKHSVRVGAHPGYKDVENFGRVYRVVDANQLEAIIKEQVDIFLESCSEVNISPYHLKPHGALYHACNHNDLESSVMVELMKKYYSFLKLLVLPGSLLAQKAKKDNIETVSESFIDRRYTSPSLLQSRSEPGSIITQIDAAVEQYNYLKNNTICTIDNLCSEHLSETACIHGDNPSVLTILKALRA